MTYNDSKDSGFTLIEIMVSLSLLGLIFLLLLGSLYTANKSWIAAERKIAQNDKIRLATVFMRRQLAQTVPIMWHAPKKKPSLLFKGLEDELSFVSILPAHRGGGGLKLITIQLEEKNTDSHQLVLFYQTIHPDRGGYLIDKTLEQNKSILIADINSVKFTYFSGELPNEHASWHSDWIDKKTLPKLIGIKIDFSKPNIQWPQIEVTLPIEFVGGQPQFRIISKHESLLN